MAVTSNRTIAIQQTGDVSLAFSVAAVENTAAPGSTTIHNLSTGFNTITLPLGATVRAATIKPPTTNTQTLTLKGVTGDTGIAIHKTDPTSIAFETGVLTFGITAGGAVTGLRIAWT